MFLYYVLTLRDPGSGGVHTTGQSVSSVVPVNFTIDNQVSRALNDSITYRYHYLPSLRLRHSFDCLLCHQPCQLSDNYQNDSLL